MFSGHILFMPAIVSNTETRALHVHVLFCLCKKIFFLLQRSVNKTLISRLSRDFTEKLFSPFCQPLDNNATPTRLKEVQLSVLSVLMHHQTLKPPDSIAAMGQNCITISFELFVYKISKELKVDKILQIANKQEVYYWIDCSKCWIVEDLSSS